jgi:hypothetical protein
MEKLYSSVAEKLVVLPGVDGNEAERIGMLLADAFPIGPSRPPWTTKEKFQSELFKMRSARRELQILAESKLGIKLP